MTTYMLVDRATQIVVNAIHVDAEHQAGETAYTPPADLGFVPFDGAIYIGGVWNGSSVTDPSAAKVAEKGTPGEPDVID